MSASRRTTDAATWKVAHQRLFDMALAAMLCLFAGCAGVAVTPLAPDGLTKLRGAESGLRYYMPMPYLLVMELPPSTVPTESTPNAAHPPPKSPGDAGTTNSTSNAARPTRQTPQGFSKPPEGDTNSAAAATAGGPGAGSSNTDDTAGKDTENSSKSSAAPVSDLSFGAATPQYVAKLVYLPDMRRPMAMKSSTGLWGTSSMKPVLQDGWMLTSLDSTADSKTAETLQALGTIAGTAIGGGAGAAAKTAAKAKAGGPGGGGGLPQLPADLSSYYGAANGILRPGLYRFNYDANGVLTSLTAVSFFTGNGTAAPGANGGFVKPAGLGGD